MTDLFERITESKQRERRRLAVLPFQEKLQLLEDLWGREAAIIVGRKREKGSAWPDRVLLVREQQAAYGAASAKGGRDAGR